MSGLDDRRKYSSTKILEIREKVAGAQEFAFGRACVYATGSFGRCEASSYSDLDLFIAGRSERIVAPDGSEGFGSNNLLTHLDEICVQGELIKASRGLGFPDFSRDGQYLARHSIYEFTHTLGTEQDDVANTFTARLLLLLESKPLLGDEIYDEIVGNVIDSYWRDYEGHEASFMPAFLANDILRIWRTFCVNYEAGTERVPDHKKADGKLKNYKLKHSRLLTCYSALLYLLAIYSARKSVSPIDAVQMTKLTPTERLEWVRDQRDFAAAKDTINELLAQYERFLGTTNYSKDVLITQFLDKEVSRRYMAAAHEFGDSMFRVLTLIGSENPFYRLLVV
jgi:hypothetical protein